MLEVEASVPADLAFLQGVCTKPFRAFPVAPYREAKRAGLLVIWTMLSVATRPGHDKVFGYGYVSPLKELVGKDRGSSFAAYAKNMIAKLDYAKPHAIRKRIAGDAAAIGSSPACQGALAVAGEALEIADPLLRPRVLFEIASMKANAFDIAGAEVLAEQLRKEYGGQPAGRQLVALLSKTLAETRKRRDAIGQSSLTTQDTQPE
jgi:hypothetical protein